MNEDIPLHVYTDQIEMLQRSLDASRQEVARLFNDNTALWKLINTLAETNRNLSSGGDQ